MIHRFSFLGLRGFMIGGGVRYIGESWDGIDVLRTPPVTLFDAMIRNSRCIPAGFLACPAVSWCL